MKKRKFLFVLTSCFLVAALVGCAKGSAKEPDTPDTPADPSDPPTPPTPPIVDPVYSVMVGEQKVNFTKASNQFEAVLSNLKKDASVTFFKDNNEITTNIASEERVGASNLVQGSVSNFYIHNDAATSTFTLKVNGNNYSFWATGYENDPEPIPVTYTVTVGNTHYTLQKDEDATLASGQIGQYTVSLNNVLKDEEVTFEADSQLISENIAGEEKGEDKNLIQGQVGSFYIHNDATTSTLEFKVWENGDYTFFASGYKEDGPTPPEPVETVYSIQIGDNTPVPFVKNESASMAQGQTSQYEVDLEDLIKDESVVFYADNTPIGSNIGSDPESETSKNLIQGQVGSFYIHNDANSSHACFKTWNDGGYSFWATGYEEESTPVLENYHLAVKFTDAATAIPEGVSAYVVGSFNNWKTDQYKLDANSLYKLESDTSLGENVYSANIGDVNPGTAIDFKVIMAVTEELVPNEQGYVTVGWQYESSIGGKNVSITPVDATPIVKTLTTVNMPDPSAGKYQVGLSVAFSDYNVVEHAKYTWEFSGSWNGWGALVAGEMSDEGVLTADLGEIPSGSYEFVIKRSAEGEEDAWYKYAGNVNATFVLGEEDTIFEYTGTVASQTIAPKGDEPVDQNFYLLGDFNEWQIADDYVMTLNGESETEYVIKDVAIEAEQKFKVYSSNTYYGYNTVKEDCRSLVTGEGDGDIFMVDSGTYDIYFDTGDNYGMWIDKQGDEPEPVTQGFYLVGDFNEWQAVEDGDYAMALKEGSETEYVIKDVEIEAEQKFKVYDSGKFYGYNTVKEDCRSLVSGEGEGDIAMLDSGTYDIYFDTGDNYGMWIDKHGDEPVEIAYTIQVGAEEPVALVKNETASLEVGQLAQYEATLTTLGEGEAVVFYADGVAITDKIGSDPEDEENKNLIQGSVGSFIIHNDADSSTICFKTWSDGGMSFWATGYEKGEEPVPVEPVYTIKIGEGTPVTLVKNETATLEDGQKAQYEATITELKKDAAVTFYADEVGIDVGIGSDPEDEENKNLIQGSAGSFVIHNDAESSTICFKTWIDGGYSFWATGYQEDEPTPVTEGFYLVGDFNEWQAVEDGGYAMALNEGSETEYVIKDVEIDAEEEFKVYNSGAYYGYNTVKEECRELVTGEGEGNIKMKEAGTYDIYFDTGDNYGMWIAKQGDEPEPVVQGFYLVGDFNEWQAVEDGGYAMTLNGESETEYVIKDIQIEAEQAFKVYNSGTFYGYNTVKEGCRSLVTGEGEGDIIMAETGTYDIYFETGDNYGMWIAKHSEPQPEQLKTFYLDPGCWDVDGAWYAAYAYGGSEGTAWFKMDKVGDYYTVEIDVSKYANIVFCRMNPASEEMNWDNRWNQSSDLTIGENNLYTITGWGKDTNVCPGAWSALEEE